MKHLILVPAVLVGVVLTTSIQLESNRGNDVVPTSKTIEIQKGEIETKPEFVGGMDGMIVFLQENIEYPKDLADKNLEAMVYMRFVVSKSGKVKDVSVLRGSDHAAFNDEATRVIEKMPNWTPGTKDGKSVNAEVTLPIRFTLAK